MRARPALPRRAEVLALDRDRAAGRLVQPAGEGEQGGLAGARTGPSRPPARRRARAKETPRRACTSVVALAVDAGHVVEVQHGALIGRWPASARGRRRVDAGRGRRAGVAAAPSTAARRSRASQWSSQRTSASAWKTSASSTSRQARSSGWSGRAARPCASAGCSPGARPSWRVRWRWMSGADVDAADGHGERQLDGQLVARRLGARHRRGEPLPTPRPARPSVTR